MKNRFAVLAASLTLAVPHLHADAQSSTLTVRWGELKVYQPVYVAMDRGFFKQYGINVELVGPFTGGPQVVQAAAAGRVDAGHTAYTGLITAAAQGFNIKGYADSQSEFKNEPLQQWFVLKDSPIRTAKDLKGKRIGVNGFSGSFYFTMLKYLSDNGLSKTDVTFVNIPHPNQEQALLTRQIDVAGVIDPYSAKLEESRQVRRLITGYDILGPSQFSVVFLTDAFVKKNPVAAARFIKAYQQAVRYIQTNPAESSRIVAKYIGVDAKYNGDHRYQPNAGVVTRDAQVWIDALEREDIIKPGSVSVSDIVSDRFVR